MKINYFDISIVKQWMAQMIKRWYCYKCKTLQYYHITVDKILFPSPSRHSWPRCLQSWQSSTWGDSNFFASSYQTGTGASLPCPGCWQSSLRERNVTKLLFCLKSCFKDKLTFQRSLVSTFAPGECYMCNMSSHLKSK